MKWKLFFIPALLSFLFSTFTLAQNIDIEGTYQLVTRKLPDGTRMAGSDIKGFATFTETHRTLNIVWKDKDGKHYSYNVVSEYKITNSEYSEKIIFSILNDEISGKGPVYTMAEQTETVPVNIVEKNIEIKMPFDPVTIVFNGDRFTATSENMFTDYWVKIKE